MIFSWLITDELGKTLKRNNLNWAYHWIFTCSRLQLRSLNIYLLQFLKRFTHNLGLKKSNQNRNHLFCYETATLFFKSFVLCGSDKLNWFNLIGKLLRDAQPDTELMDILIQATKVGDHKILQKLCASVDDEDSNSAYEEEEEEVFYDMVSFTCYPSLFGIIYCPNFYLACWPLGKSILQRGTNKMNT